MGLKPIIKWPGGKSREIKYIQDLIPKNFDRYIEPFLGGGAIFFHLNPSHSLLNDVDKNLIELYQYIKNLDPKFIKYVTKISDDWDLLIPKFAEKIQSSFFTEIKILRNSSNLSSSNKNLYSFIQKCISILNLQINSLTAVNNELFKEYLIKSLTSKSLRIIKLEKKHQIIFDNNKLLEHLQTAIKSAYYTYIRDEEASNRHEKIAQFYFIREFCYGSMFRYNKLGKFNIPYGGIDYNKKIFKSKVERLKETEIQTLFQNTNFYNLDFEDFLDKIKPTNNDLIFIDPPYDSEFKDYSQNPFSLQDQIRLANLFSSLDSKTIMIIKKTDFIQKLYTKLSNKNQNIKILNYDKTYGYNVRGRNSRHVTHLLITNFS